MQELPDYWDISGKEHNDLHRDLYGGFYAGKLEGRWSVERNRYYFVFAYQPRDVDPTISPYTHHYLRPEGKHVIFLGPWIDAPTVRSAFVRIRKAIDVARETGTNHPLLTSYQCPSVYDVIKLLRPEMSPLTIEEQTELSAGWAKDCGKSWELLIEPLPSLGAFFEWLESRQFQKGESMEPTAPEPPTAPLPRHDKAEPWKISNSSVRNEHERSRPH